MRARRLKHRQKELGRTVSVRCDMGSSTCSAGLQPDVRWAITPSAAPLTRRFVVLELFAPGEELSRTLQSVRPEVISTRRRIAADNGIITAARERAKTQVSPQSARASRTNAAPRIRESNHALFVSRAT